MDHFLKTIYGDKLRQKMSKAVQYSEVDALYFHDRIYEGKFIFASGDLLASASGRISSRIELVRINVENPKVYPRVIAHNEGVTAMKFWKMSDSCNLVCFLTPGDVDVNVLWTFILGDSSLHEYLVPSHIVPCAHSLPRNIRDAKKYLLLAQDTALPPEELRDVM
jgi:hypothetical protein